METVKVDVVIVGGGGGGLRTAISVAESDPGMKVALLSKVQPMRSHTVSAGLDCLMAQVMSWGNFAQRMPLWGG